MLTVPAHAVVNFTKSAKNKVNRRTVNTPATAKLAIKDENKPAHCFAFFSASQKTLKFKLIRYKLAELGPKRCKHVLRACGRAHARLKNLLTPMALKSCEHKKRVKELIARTSIIEVMLR